MAHGLLCLGSASAQSYPSKVVRIVTTAPGSGTELVARIVARGLTASLGQQVIVDNRGIIGVEQTAKAPPDGYTILHYTSPVWLLQLMQEVRWDAQRDFSTITLASRTPNIIVVHPSLPVASVKQLIDLARRKPGEINYAAGTLGASAHLSAELFAAMAGIRFVRVSYKGSGPAVNDLLAGQVQLMFPAAGSITAHVKSGRLKALAVTTAEPTPLAPDLPTVAQAGLPGYESISMSGYFAPAKTPLPIIQRLNQEIVRILSDPEHKQRMAALGVELMGSTPEGFAEMIKAETTRMSGVLKNAQRGP
ncbi:MAG TPA: tripartite tricarboxylate transporter substrate-binding protein [Burkholderiales bacterium]|nr:tripartite tricarboxylate transporter substrate-binding protein [Burkholderiales bacterium]